MMPFALSHREAYWSLHHSLQLAYTVPLIAGWPSQSYCLPIYHALSICWWLSTCVAAADTSQDSSASAVTSLDDDVKHAIISTACVRERQSVITDAREALASSTLRESSLPFFVFTLHCINKVLLSEFTPICSGWYFLQIKGPHSHMVAMNAVFPWKTNVIHIVIQKFRLDVLMYILLHSQ